MRDILVVFVLLALAAGCATPQLDERRDRADRTPTASAPRPSSTPRIVPSATPLAATATTAVGALREAPLLNETPLRPPATTTASPTPTSTAVPMAVAGNPRAVVLRAPAAQDGAVCGLVDLFDFPLNAPHAGDGTRGGGDDFGIYRDSFGGHHAGEDWWVSGGYQANLGAAVYSIGHGQVTYAEPLGWNRDKGVIIVRHTIADNGELLSFYGHLDEDSLELAAGDCVSRGDLIGKIGNPTTGPHLHFEIRTIMPYATGSGYLPDDPTLMGWEPPSATIWNSRMAVSPGVDWTQHFARDGLRSVETLGEERIVVLNGDHIAGIDTAAGNERWRMAVGEDVERALLDDLGRQIYTADQLGKVSAFALPDSENSGAVTGALLLWTADFDVVGMPALIPLPGGGLVLSTWDQLTAISAQGGLLWEADLEARPYDWLVSGDTLIVSTSGNDQPLWTSNGDGLQRWESDTGGHLTAAGDNVVLYDGDAVYRLELEARSLKLLRALPGGSLEAGDAAALRGGGAIIAHADRADQRLLAVDGGGNLLWERSIAGIAAGELDLFADDDQLFLVAQDNDEGGSEVSLYALDLEEVRLAQLFTGGSRSSAVDQTRLSALGNGRILISIDGRNLTVLNAAEAEHGVNSVP